MGRCRSAPSLAALVLCAGLIALSGADVLSAYGIMFASAFGDVYSLTETLVKATPLVFTGLAVAVAFRAKFWNIGAEGQLLAGAMLGCWVGGISQRSRTARLRPDVDRRRDRRRGGGARAGAAARPAQGRRCRELAAHQLHRLLWDDGADRGAVERSDERLSQFAAHSGVGQFSHPDGGHPASSRRRARRARRAADLDPDAPHHARFRHSRGRRKSQKPRPMAASASIACC